MEVSIPFPKPSNTSTTPFPPPLLLFLSLLLTVVSISEASFSPCASYSGPVKPTTPLLNFLERVQETALRTFGKPKFDPKLYVDLSLKHNLSDSELGFDKLVRSANGSVSVTDLSKYMVNYFECAGDDLVYTKPEDFVPKPSGFLPKVKNQEVRNWALKVHSLWMHLSRKVSADVRKRPELHTLIPLPGPVIIPGSRFREVYYWDSYWVIRGLLASKMYDTAKAIVTNLISLMEEYGHVLNGARTYYTNRSQPPLLSAMVREIFKKTGDLEFAKECLPALIKEHKFWTSGIHKVTIQDAQARNHTLTRYYAMWDKPRPESSTLDKEFASNISSVAEKKHFYREVASTAESGWDFSTRWMRNPANFTTLATTSILPVDLNAFILGIELDISFLSKVTGDYTVSKHFLKTSQARKKAIEFVFWNAQTGQWHDYWLSNSQCKRVQTWKTSNQNQKAFASNFIPLWIKSFYSDALLVDKVTKSLRKSGLVHPAGIATSLTISGQQWDFPNGWAPIQHMIIEGLARSGSKEARSVAEDIAVRWIRTNYVTFKKTGTMHEKYDVERCGHFGGGGEYVPQTGFGWSNGVVLALLEEFGWPEDLSIDC
ncbi:Glycoside hydrolase [Parasponia andersonii]|uniref:Trehalase n=1 Tax=Parasponia andersonii TaxID=3476 RepID=A0A2P5DJW9_PARAD|nr:Glycoside hydrolase [Parasponia andersonii]